jgi:3-methyl-2-oxobutanoate hydroxymethyltransferase
MRIYLTHSVNIIKIDALKIFKRRSEKITCLTAYDASFASVFDQCGVDIILVGDSLGNVIKGDENTLGVSMKDMLYRGYDYLVKF